MLFFAIFLITLAIYFVWKLIEERWSDLSNHYIRKAYGVPWFGLGFEFAGRDREVIFKKLVAYSFKFNGKLRANACHHKWVSIAVPEDLEQIMNDQRFFEKSDEYDMIRPWLQDGLLIVGNRKKWQSRRKVLTPAFHFKILDEFVQVFEAQGDILVGLLMKNLGKGFNICNSISLYTLDVICETSMGVKINIQTDNESEYVNSIKELTQILVWRQSHFLARDEWFWNLTSKKRHFDQLVERIHSFTVSVIENRMKEKQKLETINENDEFGVKRKMALLDILLDSKIDGLPLSTKDIQEEVDNFMFAGHDTTTSAIEFLLYNLAKYPDVQAKVYDEVMEVFKDDSEVTLSKLNDLHYLDLVIKESLRLFPPVPLLGRYLKEDVKINGTVYPAGHNVVLNVYALHRDERFHKRAAEFIPERFLEQRSHDTTNAYSYIPFSAGYRSCIGQKFAMYEIKTVISKIVKNFTVKLEKGFEVRYTWEVILRPVNGMRLELSQRE